MFLLYEAPLKSEIDHYQFPAHITEQLQNGPCCSCQRQVSALKETLLETYNHAIRDNQAVLVLCPACYQIAVIMSDEVNPLTEIKPSQEIVRQVERHIAQLN